MICRHFEEGQHLNVAGLNQMVVLIDRSETELSEVALNSWRSGLDGPPHAHEQKEQLFFITDGRGTVKIANEAFDAGPGDLFYIPAGVVHQTINQGSEPLRYILHNAFFNADKEGHSSFADHIEKVKATRKLQAQTQRADAGSVQPQPASAAKGKCMRAVSSLKPIASGASAKALLLNRAETRRCEAICVRWPSGKSVAFEAQADKEDTMFVLEGTGSIAVGGETKPVARGDVFFVPRNTVFSVQAGSEGLTCLSLGTVIHEAVPVAGGSPRKSV